MSFIWYPSVGAGNSWHHTALCSVLKGPVCKESQYQAGQVALSAPSIPSSWQHSLEEVCPITVVSKNTGYPQPYWDMVLSRLGRCVDEILLIIIAVNRQEPTLWACSRQKVVASRNNQQYGWLNRPLTRFYLKCSSLSGEPWTPWMGEEERARGRSGPHSAVWSP